MQEIRKSAEGAGTPNSAEHATKANNRKNIITQDSKTLQGFYELLPLGRDHAVSMRHLSDVLGVDERSVRLIVHHARLEGFIVAGDVAGYYIPDTKAELLRYYHSAKKRSLSGLKALKAARRKLQEPEGQQIFEDEGDV